MAGNVGPFIRAMIFSGRAELSAAQSKTKMELQLVEARRAQLQAMMVEYDSGMKQLDDFEAANPDPEEDTRV